jgi:hypothetical protein
MFENGMRSEFQDYADFPEHEPTLICSFIAFSLRRAGSGVNDSPQSSKVWRPAGGRRDWLGEIPRAKDRCSEVESKDSKKKIGGLNGNWRYTTFAAPFQHRNNVFRGAYGCFAGCAVLPERGYHISAIAEFSATPEHKC